MMRIIVRGSLEPGAITNGEKKRLKSAENPHSNSFNLKKITAGVIA